LRVIPTTPEEEAALELAKEGVTNLLEPVKDLLQRLLGPAATEIGLGWGDSFRVWRLKRQVRLLQEVGQAALDAGLDLKPVPLRLLFPILEAAPLQDDEDLHQRWVALLTNAASTAYDSEMLPCFPDILRQLTSPEARFLDRAYDELATGKERILLHRLPEHQGQPPQAVRISGDVLKSADPIMVDNLERLKLVSRSNVFLSTDDTRTNTFPSGNHLYISEFGKAFIRACRLPLREKVAV
jgi:Abortive infection alpha